MSEVSIIIPTFNGAAYVGEAIGSVCAQTQPPLEIVVVDDCSTDDTLAVVEALAARSPVPIRTIRLPANSGGPARPINVGVREARGELVAVLDQDDVYQPEILGRAAAALAAEPRAALAFYGAGSYDALSITDESWGALRQRLQARGIERRDYCQISGQALLETLLEEGTFILGFPGFVFRRRDFLDKGGVDESLRVCGDMELLGWLFQRGEGVFIPEIGYRRRLHDANVTRNGLRMNSEIAVVTARLIAGNPRLNPQAIATAKGRLHMFAYWFRQGQCYDESARVYRLLAELGQPRRHSLLALAKLRVHRMLTSLSGRPPVPNPLTRTNGPASHFAGRHSELSKVAT